MPNYPAYREYTLEEWALKMLKEGPKYVAVGLHFDRDVIPIPPPLRGNSVRYVKLRVVEREWFGETRTVVVREDLNQVVAVPPKERGDA